VLIDRSVRPLALTPAGEVYAEGCTAIIDQCDELERRVATMRKAPEGRVRVAAIYSAGIGLLNGVTERFESAHPGVKVEIVYDHPNDVYQRVLDKRCDLGILSYPAGWRKVGIVPLREETMAVVTNPSHELAVRSSIHVSELTPYSMVTFDTELPAGRKIRQYLREHGADPTIRHSFDNIDTIKEAVAVTDRISILPIRTVLRDVQSGTLSAVELEPKLTRQIGIIHRHRSRNGKVLPPAQQAFVDYLCEHAGPSVDAEVLAEVHAAHAAAERERVIA